MAKPLLGANTAPTTAAFSDTPSAGTAGANAALADHRHGMPANPASGSIDVHSDVDTTTSPPAAAQVLAYNGSLWVPGRLYRQFRGVVAVPFVFQGTLAGSATAFLNIADMVAGVNASRMPFGAEVVGISVSLAVARTAGTLTVGAYNGSTASAVGPTALIDGTTTNYKNVSEASIGAADITTGSQLQCRVITASFTPVVNSVLVMLYLLLDVE